MDWIEWLVVGGVALSILWLLSAVWTTKIALRRGGRGGRWFLYGILLGPFGVWLAYWMVRPCPACSAPVLRDVFVCPACTAPIPRLAAEDRPEDYLKTYRKNW